MTAIQTSIFNIDTQNHLDKSAELFMAIGDIIEVNDYYQTDYRYRLEAPAGKNFADGFGPHFTPKEMLKLGVFEGKYCNDCIDEFPKSWFAAAKISDIPDPAMNYFGVKSRQPLSVWRDKGWIYGPDPPQVLRRIVSRPLVLAKVDQWKAMKPTRARRPIAESSSVFSTSGPCVRGDQHVVYVFVSLVLAVVRVCYWLVRGLEDMRQQEGLTA